MKMVIASFLLLVIVSSYVAANEEPVVDGELMKYAEAASKMTFLTKDYDDLDHVRQRFEDEAEIYFGPDATYYFEDNGNDLGAVVKDSDGLCWYHAPSSESPPNQPWDWAENFSPIKTRICDQQNNETCCTVWDGFYRGFADVPGIDEKVHECVKECQESGSEYKGTCLILSGHSRGGAVATIASVLYNDYNPLVITFGEPPIFVETNEESCDLNIANPGRKLRFVNSRRSDSSFNWVYDPAGVSFDLRKFGFKIIVEGREVRFNGGHHYGEYILIQNGSPGSKYFGLNGNEYFLQYPDVTLEAHSYFDQIVSLADELSSNGGTLDLSGFSVNAACNYNDHCGPRAKCVSGTCKIIAGIGEFCDTDEQCSRGYCSQNKCLLDLLESCTKNSSCASGRCAALSWWERWIPWRWKCIWTPGV